MLVLVRGVGDVGSAVAHRLFGAGYGVVIHDDPEPTTSRRGMAFTDAVFDGHAVLEGVRAVCIDDLEQVKRAVVAHEVIPVSVRPLAPLLAGLQPQVLVDARMRKHAGPEIHSGLADFTIALGPSLVVGRHADVVIETSWEDLGRVITTGASLPLGGEPRAIDGHARDRYVYAPIDGVFRTTFRIGDAVRQGQEVAHIDSTALAAPLDGVLRGLTRDAVPVTVRTKVIEVDPRGRAGGVRGIAERPRRIADGVLTAITDRSKSPSNSLTPLSGTETLRKAPRRSGFEKVRSNYSRKVVVEGKGVVGPCPLILRYFDSTTRQNAAERDIPRNQTQPVFRPRKETRPAPAPESPRPLSACRAHA